MTSITYRAVGGRHLGGDHAGRSQQRKGNVGEGLHCEDGGKEVV
jgi:hypothetical protein